MDLANKAPDVSTPLTLFPALQYPRADLKRD